MWDIPKLNKLGVILNKLIKKKKHNRNVVAQFKWRVIDTTPN